MAGQLIQKILFVDDDENMCCYFRKTLVRGGYAVEIAKDSTEALKKLDKTFRLVLLDIIMPDINGEMSKRAGIDVLRRIVEDFPDIPVIMLTARTDFDPVKECLKLGAIDYFVKGEIAEGTEKFLEKIATSMGG